jgi:hypothetical protein
MTSRRIPLAGTTVQVDCALRVVCVTAARVPQAGRQLLSHCNKMLVCGCTAACLVVVPGTVEARLAVDFLYIPQSLQAG